MGGRKMSKSKQIVLAVVAVMVFSVLATSAMAYSGRIGDCVWEDANGDGIAQATEHGIDGVTVTMYRQKADGTFSTNPFVIAGVPNPQTTRSAVPPATLPFPPTQVFTKPAADGWYSFSQALEGTYLMVVSGVPNGYVPTFDLDDGVLDGLNDTPNQAIVTLSINDRLDVDFGYRKYVAPPTYEVGDRVWHDRNYNGAQDASEEGINGATVKLLDETGNAVLDANGTPRTATTSTVNGVDGYYLFAGLLAGNYIVEVSGTQSGWECTADLDLDKDSNSGIFSLTANRYDVDFGYAAPPTYEVGDRVWQDTNRNGTQDAGEPGVNGATVNLLDEAGNVVKTASTSTVNGVEGYYIFTGLLAGKYVVQVSDTPSGWTCTYDLDGDLDSNSGVFSLSASRYDVDFGYAPPPTYEVGDRVWHDLNYNGRQDTGEEGINGATVKLLDEAGNAVLDANGNPRTATTSTVNGVDGYYLFAGLAADKYIVEVSGTPIGWACTYDLDLDTDSNSGIFSLNANRYDVDFGYAEVPDTGFCTFTQGGWGAKPKGNNPGTILEKNWGIFGGVLTVGGTNNISFTKASSVTNFLPQGGTAAALTTSYVDPTKKINVLAGQVVALRLNVAFSNAGVTQPGIALKTIQSGPYTGQSVGQFLLAAEAALGGASGYNLTAINDTATKINESFDNGTTNTGFIK
jgi:hypothetical protein